MTKLELLERIANTTNFLEFDNDEFMEVLNTMAVTDNRVLLAYCLHIAYINGRRIANENMMAKAQTNIQWCDAMQALATSLLKELSV